MNNNDEFKIDDNNDNFQEDGFKTEESNSKKSKLNLNLNLKPIFMIINRTLKKD